MTTKETLNAIVAQIEELQKNTKSVRDTTPHKWEVEACVSKEVAYQECVMIILKAQEEL